jgi:ribosomal-protein-serine acetyltransferase
MFTHVLSPNAELRLLEPRYAEEVFALVDCNREHLRKWMPWVDETKTVGDSIKFIKEGLLRLAEKGSFDAGIWYQGKLAGIIGFMYHSQISRQAEIGYWLGQEFEGKGLVTTACKAIIKHAFINLNINRLAIRAATENIRSRAVAERLGFTLEGVERQTANLYGKFHDLAIYSLLKEEWIRTANNE